MSTPGTFTSGVTRELNFELLIMRVACALPFIFHGSAILFGAFGGPGPTGFAAFMHAPAPVGYLVGLAQFAGGLAILLGALLRVGAICVMIVMVGAFKNVNPATSAVYGNQAGLIQNLGHTLFNDFALPFEVSSILFLAAMVGAVMLGKKEIQ